LGYWDLVPIAIGIWNLVSAKAEMIFEQIGLEATQLT